MQWFWHILSPRSLWASGCLLVPGCLPGTFWGSLDASWEPPGSPEVVSCMPPGCFFGKKSTSRIPTSPVLQESSRCQGPGPGGGLLQEADSSSMSLPPGFFCQDSTSSSRNSTSTSSSSRVPPGCFLQELSSRIPPPGFLLQESLPQEFPQEPSSGIPPPGFLLQDPSSGFPAPGLQLFLHCLGSLTGVICIYICLKERTPAFIQQMDDVRILHSSVSSGLCGQWLTTPVRHHLATPLLLNWLSCITR